MSDFDDGDLVQLRSGGPAMTIKEFSQGTYVCEWFTKEQELRTAKFSPASLAKYAPPQQTRRVARSLGIS